MPGLNLRLTDEEKAKCHEFAIAAGAKGVTEWLRGLLSSPQAEPIPEVEPSMTIPMTLEQMARILAVAKYDEQDAPLWCLDVLMGAVECTEEHLTSEAAKPVPPANRVTKAPPEASRPAQTPTYVDRWTCSCGQRCFAVQVCTHCRSKRPGRKQGTNEHP
jgi:hypothetical protein